MSDKIEVRVNDVLVFSQAATGTQPPVVVPPVPPVVVPAGVQISPLPWGPGIQTFSPDGGPPRERITQQPGTVRAWSIPVSQLPTVKSDTNPNGRIKIDSGGVQVEVCLSGTPGDFSGDRLSHKTQGGEFFIDYAMHPSPWVADKAAMDYWGRCLRPDPDASGSVYVSVKVIGLVPASYYIFYQ